MNKQSYFLITSTEDGDIRIQQVTIRELQEHIKDVGPNFISLVNLEKNSDPMYWGEKTLLIKGEIIVPKPKQKVIEWEF